MEEVKQILALSRLLEYSSIKKYGVQGKTITFKDEIGLIAVTINDRIKKSKGLDIFNKKITIDQLNKYEHLISNSISNYTNRRLIKRDIIDEVEILLNSKTFSNNELEKYKLSVSGSFREQIDKIPDLTEEKLIELTKSPQHLSALTDGDLNTQYFANSELTINKTKYIITTVLRHESRKEDELAIVCFIIFPFDSHSKYIKRPTHLFLKGLDKYGIDMKIGANVARYYYRVSVPKETNINDFSFLNLQNFDAKNDFVTCFAIKFNENSIDLVNVFAINTTIYENDIKKYFA